MNRHGTLLGLSLLAAAAFLLRLGLVLALARSGTKPFAYEHGEIARNLVEGKGFSVRYLGQEGPTSQQAPLYPLLLAALYRCLGTESMTALLSMQVLQCLAGSGIVLAATWLGWSLLPARRSIGWLAGIGATIYPPHIYMVTHIQVAVWAALLHTLTVAVTCSPRWRASRRGALLAGALGGLLLLTEPILALAMPILAWIFWRGLPGEKPASPAGAWRPRLTFVQRMRASGGFSWIAPALFALAAVLVVGPWLIRNWRVHGEFVFVKSSFGYALWQGNNVLSWGTDKIPKAGAAEMLQAHDGSLAGANAALWNARHETLYIDDVLLAPGGYREFVGLSEPARSRLLGHRAQEFIRNQPARYAALCGQRLRYFLLWDETNPKAAHPVYRASSIGLLSLAFVGLSLAGGDRRRLWPTMWIVAAVAAFHTLTIVSARFRIPVEPLALVWAAVGLAALAGAVRAKLDARARLPVHATEIVSLRSPSALSPIACVDQAGRIDWEKEMLGTPSCDAVKRSSLENLATSSIQSAPGRSSPPE